MSFVSIISLTGTKANIAHLMTQPRFELVRHDLTFPLYVEVDKIYNLACPASPTFNYPQFGCVTPNANFEKT